MTQSSDVILDVNQVWKRYGSTPAVGQGKAARILFDSLLGFGAKGPVTGAGEQDIIKGLSFSLKRGEALGVIGFNGAGKTTLLRLLAGQLLPDQGQVRVRGTTGAMIDLTSGMKDTMTGRANILLRSAILGRRRKDVEANLEEIIDFTELGDNINSPVSTYSAGMRMRLAFATTVFMNPDLLLADEVLSVGDFRFRQKCLERIRTMRDRSAFVLVSHSMNDISRFCDQVIVLDKGRAAFTGPPDEAIAYYYNESEKRTAPKKTYAEKRPLGDFIEKTHAVTDVSATWVDENGNETPSFRTGSPMSLKLRFTPLKPFRNLIVGVPIYSSRNEMVTALSSDQMQIRLDHEVGKPCDVQIDIDHLPLSPGNYRPVLTIVDGPEFLYRQPIDPFDVLRGDLPKYWGEFVIAQRWTTHG